MQEQSRSSSSVGILGILLDLFRGARASRETKSESQTREPYEPSPLTSREQLLLEQWKLASELHRHQDSLIWNQFNYFTTFNLALFPIIGAVWSFLNNIPLVAVFLSLLLTFLVLR